MINKEICSNVYSKFDLSTQAIVLPKKDVRCLYFEFFGSDFLMKLFENVLEIEKENLVYLANGYRSNIEIRHFLKMKGEDVFFKFIISEDYIFKDETGTYKYDEFEAMGIIVTNEDFNWLIHRDPDFGTITFAYNDRVETTTIYQLMQNSHYVGNIPKPEFYTDYLDF
ncbi:hypothetical protein [Chryseobacterium indoltheticum]|jgi:hypothetical protein|uniref:hypothetical protein n=1 Tax=Chryseobacterium indoltheticum TaxID=254 RepID=UPI00242C715A|nr:hypothetical protein [Chryseobacterium indoltheticum]MDF2833046.1 hypothetical protein [Chryseobacterium indoltheticum]